MISSYVRIRLKSLFAAMDRANKIDGLEQANDWLTKRLQTTEEQVREGEDVNVMLTDENRHLKTVCSC